MPNPPNRWPKRLHFLGLPQLFSNKIPIHQLLIIDAHGHQKSVFDGTVHERLHNHAQDTVFWHAGFSSPGAASFKEELHIVTGAQTFVHVGVQDGFVDVVFATHYRIDPTFDEEGSKASQQRSEDWQIFVMFWKILSRSFLPKKWYS